MPKGSISLPVSRLPAGWTLSWEALPSTVTVALGPKPKPVPCWQVVARVEDPTGREVARYEIEVDGSDAAALSQDLDESLARPAVWDEVEEADHPEDGQGVLLRALRRVLNRLLFSVDPSVDELPLAVRHPLGHEHLVRPANAAAFDIAARLEKRNPLWAAVVRKDPATREGLGRALALELERAFDWALNGTPGPRVPALLKLVDEMLWLTAQDVFFGTRRRTGHAFYVAYVESLLLDLLGQTPGAPGAGTGVGHLVGTIARHVCCEEQRHELLCQYCVAAERSAVTAQLWERIREQAATDGVQPRVVRALRWYADRRVCDRETFRDHFRSCLSEALSGDGGGTADACAYLCAVVDGLAPDRPKRCPKVSSLQQDGDAIQDLVDAAFLRAVGGAGAAYSAAELAEGQKRIVNAVRVLARLLACAEQPRCPVHQLVGQQYARMKGAPLARVRRHFVLPEDVLFHFFLELRDAGRTESGGKFLDHCDRAIASGEGLADEGVSLHLAKQLFAVSDDDGYVSRAQVTWPDFDRHLATPVPSAAFGYRPWNELSRSECWSFLIEDEGGPRLPKRGDPHEFDYGTYVRDAVPFEDRTPLPRGTR